MRTSRTARTLVALLLLFAVPPLVRADDTPEGPGHSSHGSAFDSGLRQRPWRMEGMGHSHFPITSHVPEVQEWFDQGNTLLHSFWFEEAERSFRWCLKLEPDCAMAYWGLARCGLNWFARGPVDGPESKRWLDFLAEAVRREATVTARERRYIDAWNTAFTGDGRERLKTLAKELQQIVLDYPDDVEAKALYALFSIDHDHALGTELILQQVFAREPDHPGAHHARIHNWDGVASKEALESCRAYGLVAPESGHANHMPGHIYSKVGMWNEAAYSMDHATRIELKYMNDRLALPFESWNYPHNRNYLCYIQEQLGMAEASLRGAHDLLNAPRDPDRNKDGGDGASDQGTTALVRALLKFERWDEVLKPGAIAWRDLESDKRLRLYAEAVALTGEGKLVDARSRVDQLKAIERKVREGPDGDGEKVKSKRGDPDLSLQMRAATAEGLLRAAEGDLLEATRLLTSAADLEKRSRASRDYVNDPPDDPWPTFRVLGDVYRRHGDHKLALDAYERALTAECNDAFSLAGLALEHAALGERDQASECAGRLNYLWVHADPALKWKRDVDALGLNAAPVAKTPAPERSYTPDALASIGPLEWQPYAAPELDCLDADGAPVRLSDFRGKNVLLVYYLGEECVHCVEQLVAINGHADDWKKENTVVLAVSGASPAKNRDSQKLANMSLRLLSDQDHANARRFASYDDFEEIELHSTIVIDAQGRVQWKRTGGDPFRDVDFLLKTVAQLQKTADQKS